MRPLSLDFLGPEVTALLLTQLAISPALVVPRDSGSRRVSGVATSTSGLFTAEPKSADVLLLLVGTTDEALSRYSRLILLANLQLIDNASLLLILPCYTNSH